MGREKRKPLSGKIRAVCEYRQQMLAVSPLDKASISQLLTFVSINFIKNIIKENIHVRKIIAR